MACFARRRRSTRPSPTRPPRSPTTPTASPRHHPSRRRRPHLRPDRRGTRRLRLPPPTPPPPRCPADKGRRPGLPLRRRRPHRTGPRRAPRPSRLPSTDDGPGHPGRAVLPLRTSAPSNPVQPMVSCGAMPKAPEEPIPKAECMATPGDCVSAYKTHWLQGKDSIGLSIAYQRVNGFGRIRPKSLPPGSRLSESSSLDGYHWPDGHYLRARTSPRAEDAPKLGQ